jgi:hypothetical protein
LIFPIDSLAPSPPVSSGAAARDGVPGLSTGRPLYSCSLGASSLFLLARPLRSSSRVPLVLRSSGDNNGLIAFPGVRRKCILVLRFGELWFVGCVRFSSQASDFVIGVGSLYLGCIFVGVQVRFLFLRAFSNDDGFVRIVLASSLRRGGSGSCSHRSWRGSCQWVFNASDVARWCRVAGSCGGFHVFDFLDDSSERLTMLVSAWRHEVQSFSWKIMNFANRSFRFLFACFFSFKGLWVFGNVPSSNF